MINTHNSAQLFLCVLALSIFWVMGLLVGFNRERDGDRWPCAPFALIVSIVLGIPLVVSLVITIVRSL